MIYSSSTSSRSSGSDSSGHSSSSSSGHSSSSSSGHSGGSVNSGSSRGQASRNSAILLQGDRSEAPIVTSQGSRFFLGLRAKQRKQNMDAQKERQERQEQLRTEAKKAAAKSKERSQVSRRKRKRDNIDIQNSNHDVVIDTEPEEVFQDATKVHNEVHSQANIQDAVGGARGLLLSALLSRYGRSRTVRIYTS